MSSAKPLNGQDSEILLKAFDKVKARPDLVSGVLTNLFLRNFHGQPFTDIFQEGEVFDHTHAPTDELECMFRFVFSELANPLSQARVYTSEVHSQIIRHKIKNPEMKLPLTDSYSLKLGFNWSGAFELAWKGYDGSAKYLKSLPLEIGTKLAISPQRYYALIVFEYVKWLRKVAQTETDSADLSVFDALVRELGLKAESD